MGSSSAFTVSLLYALYALRGERPSKSQLASESIFLEQETLQETVGSQDQVMAAYGGFRHVQFLPNGEILSNPLLLPAARMARGPDTPRTDARPVRPRMLAQPQISNFPQKTIFEARQIRDAEKAARCGKRHSARVN